MVESKENWKEIIKRAEDTGCDGLELNFGCPHGMCEGGMGRAVGQEPKVLEEITRWAMEYAQTPVIIKLTPNTSDINAGEAVARGGAPAISLINTVVALESIDRFVPTHGGNNPPLLRPRGQTHRFFAVCFTKNPATKHLTYRWRNLELARCGRVRWGNSVGLHCGMHYATAS